MANSKAYLPAYNLPLKCGQIFRIESLTLYYDFLFTNGFTILFTSLHYKNYNEKALDDYTFYSEYCLIFVIFTVSY